MGHGDEIVLADANFPSVSVAASTVDGVIRADGVSIPELLTAILQLLPLDGAVEHPCALMAVMPQHKAAGMKTPVWDVYKSIVNKAEGRVVPFEEVERFAFYERAKRSMAIVATG
jgi:L-fucose mutarotase